METAMQTCETRRHERLSSAVCTTGRFTECVGQVHAVAVSLVLQGDWSLRECIGEGEGKGK